MENLRKKIIFALDKIRPYLQADGGDVELVEITSDNIVKVRFLGACSNCERNIQTLKAGVEHTVKTIVPEIKEVIAV